MAERVRALLDRITMWCAGFASACLVIVMVITFLDVMGRYLFNAPITFSVELIELSMGLLVCFGLVITTLRRGHIAVDLVTTLFGGFVMSILRRLAALAGVIFFALFAWRLADRAAGFSSDGLRTQVLFMPVAPVVFLMTIAAVLTVVVAVYMLVAPRRDTDREVDGSPGGSDLDDAKDL